MYRILTCILFCFFAGGNGFAADSTVLITPYMFSINHELLIGESDGWRFNKNPPEFVVESPTDTGWIKLKPVELSAAMADKSGRLEGWFRIRINTGNQKTYLRYSGWAAAELYVNGKQLRSFGNTGDHGQPFKDYNYSNDLYSLVELPAAQEHLILLHFVDFLSAPGAKSLKSEYNGLKNFIKVTNENYYQRFTRHIRIWPIYSTIWASVCILISFLFWLLRFLNRDEKNLKWFASLVSVTTIFYICRIVSEDNRASFETFRLLTDIHFFTLIISYCITILIVALVFKRKVGTTLKLILAAYLLSGIIQLFISFNRNPGAVMTLVTILIYSYYIISSWKTLKGAQWAIVAGITLSSLIVLAYAVQLLTYPSAFVPGYMLLVTGIALTNPLALLVYVALRFREIIRETQISAAQVLRLSEEKRHQAEKQQKILEEEVARQTAELRSTLNNLKATQSQLIQSEKMASLGELTAGIAHEIQNPLNFVNNFSEVSVEMIVEAEGSRQQAGENSPLVSELLTDIKHNLEKINHHGKRADAIVKNMLQHSRTGRGEKEPTAINALADEYLRLAYHAFLSGRSGLEGKNLQDASKNISAVIIKTDFDPAIGKINIIPQDMGRVLLNLYNNAFYAVREKYKEGEKQKTEIRSDVMHDFQGYHPTVSVSTKKQGDQVIIKVKDNGNGIPQKVIDKIFQPFFTTKPTGQGTGLGLSLSYDIIKALGGEIKVWSAEEQGSEFIVSLPLV